jgi:hypothetical protein
MKKLIIMFCAALFLSEYCFGFDTPQQRMFAVRAAAGLPGLATFEAFPASVSSSGKGDPRDIELFCRIHLGKGDGPGAKEGIEAIAQILEDGANANAAMRSAPTERETRLALASDTDHREPMILKALDITPCFTAKAIEVARLEIIYLFKKHGFIGFDPDTLSEYMRAMYNALPRYIQALLRKGGGEVDILATLRSKDMRAIYDALPEYIQALLINYRDKVEAIVTLFGEDSLAMYLARYMESLFTHLEKFRGVDKRCKKLAQSFKSMVYIACSSLYLKRN